MSKPSGIGSQTGSPFAVVVMFFGNGFDLSMHRRDCTDALWAATLAANKGPGQWYADSDSLRYSFFDKIESGD